MGRPTLLLQPITVAFLFSNGSLYECALRSHAQHQTGYLNETQRGQRSRGEIDHVVVVDVVIQTLVVRSLLHLAQVHQATLVQRGAAVHVLHGRDGVENRILVNAG